MQLSGIFIFGDFYVVLTETNGDKKEIQCVQKKNENTPFEAATPVLT